MFTYRTALSIAGSDCSGGAGIQADIKTMSALGVYAMTAITAITVQNTCGVTDVQGIDPSIVYGQIDAVFNDIRPMAVKTGMLFSADIANAVADALTLNRAENVVLDPVMVATSGDRLLSDDAIDTIVNRLIPLSTIITPNVDEAAVLTGTDNPVIQSSRLHEMGARSVLLKGGDRNNDTDVSVDLLSLAPGQKLIPIESRRIVTANTHGTGCTLSSAIASFLAKGYDIHDSVVKAKNYIYEALKAGARVRTGSGHGPVDHLYAPVPLDITITK